MELGYRGSVNRWECDENDHLNVRFYVEKHWQTCLGGLSGKTGEPFNAGDIQVAHLRFLAESRIATPLSGYWGVVRNDRDGWEIVSELKQSFTEEVVSTCRFQGFGVIAGLANVSDSLPEHAAAKGIANRDHDWTRCAMDELGALGFKQIGRGTITAAEVDRDGTLALLHYMGRLSDSMPHLWGALDSDSGMMADNRGGAVLEYRLRHHEALRAGDVYVIHSGLAEAGAKVQRFVHLMSNALTGQRVLSAEAVGVRMDLIARKAVTLDDGALERMRSMQLSKP